MTPPSRFVVSLLCCLVLPLTLTACAPEGRELSAPTPTATTSLSPTSQPAPEETVEPGYAGAPITAGCGDLVSDQTMYDWGSGNFALDSAYSPSPGSDAARAVADGGLACGWVNLTSGETMTVAVADLSVEALAAAKAAVPASRSAVSEFGPNVDARFENVSDVGNVDAFAGSYWVSAKSPWFAEPSDASAILYSVLNALH